MGVIDFYVYLKELYKSLNKGGIKYIDIIDGDLDSFTFKESELKRQAIALKSFYKDGSSFLFTVNSSSNLTNESRYTKCNISFQKIIIWEKIKKL